MQFRYLLISLLILFLSLASCEQIERGEEKLKIAVIPKGTTHVFWKSVQAGALKAGEETGTEIVWIGPEREDSRQQQIALIDNQVMKGVAGIVLAPLDAMALRRPVRNAVTKGIPVVIIDSGLKDAQELYTSFVATDNTEGGRIAARELAAMIAEQGNIIVLRYSEGSASTENRERGFLEEIKKFKNIEVVSSEQYGGATTSMAQQAAENLLLRFMRDNGTFKVDGIFCPNESTTYGMLQALRRKRLAGKVKFVGFDSSPPLIEGLRQDEINGLVVQDPFKMGYMAVKSLYAYLNNSKVGKTINTRVTFVTKENISDEEVKELITPDLEKWLNR